VAATGMPNDLRVRSVAANAADPALIASAPADHRRAPRRAEPGGIVVCQFTGA